MITFSHPGVLALPSRLVCSHFRGCTSPEVGGTCGLVPTSLPWQSGSQDGDSAPGMATQGGGSLGSSVWKKRKGVQGKARSQSVEPSREVVSFSPDHLSQDPGFLYSISSSQLNLTPQSWLTPFSCCLALKCYLLPSAFEAYSTKCISEVCWQLILSLACDTGDLGRESWTPTQPAVSCCGPPPGWADGYLLPASLQKLAPCGELCSFCQICSIIVS